MTTTTASLVTTLEGLAAGGLVEGLIVFVVVLAVCWVIATILSTR